ncbi:nucleotidyltransferase domain-containing protein [Candidatus Woesearchaeota archaeon]|nr:nucleotidyltransferase domain-containing protein [Candidatus Woesearchaeota archaeon]
MYKELSILKLFFEDPLAEFHLREVARLTNSNHMTVRSHLNKLTKENILIKKPGRLFTTYSTNANSQKYLNLKLYYNLEKLRESNLIKDLEYFYDYPVIILFGSYSKATNVKESDIDIAVITNIRKEFKTDKYKKILQREVNLRLFQKKELRIMRLKNPELINSLCNGIVLSGQLVIVL